MSESETATKNKTSDHISQGRLKYFIGDPYSLDDPQKLTMRRKQVIIAVVALSAVTGPIGSMIYMPALLAVADDLHTSSEAVNGTVSAYVVFMGVAVRNKSSQKSNQDSSCIIDTLATDLGNIE